MKKHNIITDLEKNNIKWGSFGGIDNVLLKNVDPLLLGLTIKNNYQIASKSIFKEDPLEKTAVYCKKYNKPAILDYDNIDLKLSMSKYKNGMFKYREANMLSHLMSIEAVKKVSDITLPYHRAFKKNPFVNSEGVKEVPSKPNSFKFENFIFDAFSYFDDMLLLRVDANKEFAPIKDLGIIIIDEEHDSSYKSESTPRYNAKDIARYLCKENNIPLVLGSATPDTSSLYRTMQKESVLLRLNKRANSSTLPEIEVIDLREELSKKNKSMLSEKLQEAIKENLENKKQTILFLNRRGFSTFVMCRDCGYTAKCKNCDITLTYHKSTNKLKCHYCGYETNVINKCPDCKSENIRYFGTGTQKLEAEKN